MLFTRVPRSGWRWYTYLNSIINFKNMEALLLILAWPLLIFIVGFLIISFVEFLTGGFAILVVIAIIIAMLAFMEHLKKKVGTELKAQSIAFQSVIVSFSIGLLVPMFARELLIAADRALVAMIIALLFGFGLIVWGAFLKGNDTLRRANLVGGILTVFYSYSQLWDLGQGPRIIAAAIGLVAAVSIGIIRFKDKLS